MGIQKTACFGACPVYSMDILSNCKVILHADKFLEMGTGDFKSKLSKIKYEELIHAFRQTGYFELDEIYRSNITDLPTTYFYFKDNGKAKTIEVYGKWPNDLTALDKKLTALIEELKWKKVSDSKY
ncbi:MAG TPA: DUF6438 domain-containing protein [Cyclobacteriaceae bacterium]